MTVKCGACLDSPDGSYEFCEQHHRWSHFDDAELGVIRRALNFVDPEGPDDPDLIDALLAEVSYRVNERRAE